MELRTALSLAALFAALPVRGAELLVEGGRLYYEERGRGPAVVLIHGGFGDRRMWERQLAPLARDFRVVRYDHRGFGRSSSPAAAYSPAADLLRLLDRLGLQRAHLVGNSMGGTLALDFTLLHPQRVDRLVIVASGPAGAPVPEEARQSVVRVFDAAKTRGTRAAAEMWLQHPMVAVASRDPGARGLLRKMIFHNHGVFLMEHWPSERLEPAAFGLLGDVKAPTLVIAGDQDTALVRSIADAAARGIPGARLEVLAGADHLPQMVKPVEFNALVRAFLLGR